jgi:hypothetical protein
MRDSESLSRAIRISKPQGKAPEGLNFLIGQGGRGKTQSLDRSIKAVDDRYSGFRASAGLDRMGHSAMIRGATVARGSR